MKLCTLFAFQLLAVVNLILGSEEKWKCTIGTPYQENECNNCFCTENGGLACTEKACSGPPYTTLRNCTVGTAWEKECNKCRCVKDFGTICTTNKC